MKIEIHIQVQKGYQHMNLSILTYVVCEIYCLDLLQNVNRLKLLYSLHYDMFY